MQTAENPNKKRVLLLQGPMGFFFRRLARFLEAQGFEVYKINFNAGDDLFFPFGKVSRYRGTLDDWPQYLADFIERNRIDAVFLFGDCRHYHLAAKDVVEAAGAACFAFEEGYIRPDYITLERGGVNGHSSLPKQPDFYTSEAAASAPEASLAPVRHNHAERILSVAAYYAALGLFRLAYPHYVHHKTLGVWAETFRWLWAYTRRPFDRLIDSPVTKELRARYQGKYFLVPLQVFNDSQVLRHSQYESVEAFLREVIASFAQHAPRKTLLVIKHHPMDRGHTRYGELIKEEAARCGIAKRIRYIHEGHLPSLLQGARGTVLINSTVGISSLYHNTPVKVLGKAVYDLPGLTAQVPLAQFWRAPGKVDRELFKLFRAFVISETQLRGAFYGTSPFLTPRAGKGLIVRPAPAALPGAEPQRSAA